MDWRKWMYERLTGLPALTALVPAEQIHGSGSLTGAPEKKPFLVISMGPIVPGPFPGLDLQTVVLWAHDEPGSYRRIGDALQAIRGSLAPDGGRQGQVLGLPGGIASRWQGDSTDLADETFRTITRNSTYQLSGVS